MNRESLKSQAKALGHEALVAALISVGSVLVNTLVRVVTRCRESSYDRQQDMFDGDRYEQD